MAARRSTGILGTLGVCVGALLAAGCGDAADSGGALDEAQALELSFEEKLACDPAGSAKCAKRRASAGRKLFDEETFGGNGRRCVTCHSVNSGTFNPEEARARLAADPNDPLFRHDGLDDGVEGTSRITEHATLRIELELPPHVRLKNDPNATHIVVHRGVPTTMDTPALDPVLMHDGRAEDLQDQAFSAILGHAEATRTPTDLELDLIAEFERTDRRFFSSEATAAYATGGPAPQLPSGTTEAEKRGRAMFDDVPFDPVTKRGLCAMCHSGPMLNEANSFHLFGAPPGARFGTAFVSERNLMNNPAYTFVVDDGITKAEITSPDPGVLLTHPRPAKIAPFFPSVMLANIFKTPTVWGVGKTAPYFHDNSAKTLEDVAEQYDFFLRANLGIPLTAEEQAAIVAFMKLL